MNRLVAAVLPILLAACPAKGGGTGPNPQAGAGCPSAAGVYVASYVAQEPGKGRSGWVMPLHAKADDGSVTADYMPIDASAVSAAGGPALPTGTLWLVTEKAPPCKVKLGGHYAAKLPGPPASISYGVELDGCPPVADPEGAGGFVMASEEAPTSCRFEPPQPVAARMGQMDQQKQWQRPTKETPIPAPIMALVPPHTCDPPDCETVWAFGEIKIDGKTVAWTGAINWLAIGAPADQCSWKVERYSGFFVPGAGGTAVKVTDGQAPEHPLVLSAALADASGAKVLLAEGPGEYATYGVSPTGAPLGHHITYMVAPQDAWDAVDHLGPICDGQAAH